MAASGNLVLVDTSAWICFFARKNFAELKKCITILLRQDLVAIAGPMLLELVQGARNEKERAETEARLRALHWLNMEERHWWHGADLSFRLRRKGITISAIDAMIAVLAIDYSCQLLHCDSDFELIAQHSDLNIFSVSP